MQIYYCAGWQISPACLPGFSARHRAIILLLATQLKPCICSLYYWISWIVGYTSHEGCFQCRGRCYKYYFRLRLRGAVNPNYGSGSGFSPLHEHFCGLWIFFYHIYIVLLDTLKMRSLTWVLAYVGLCDHDFFSEKFLQGFDNIVRIRSQLRSRHS